MKSTFGKSLRFLFKFFQSIGRPFLRYTYLRVLLVAFLILTSWQVGTFSVSQIRVNAVNCSGLGEQACYSNAGSGCTWQLPGDNRPHWEGSCDGPDGNPTPPPSTPPPNGDPSECSFTGTQDEGCECNTDACIGVMWTASCDNGKEVRYNVQKSSCNYTCAGKCTMGGAGSCGSVPNGGFIRRGDTCEWDGTNTQCVRVNFKCDNSKEVSYTTYDASCAGQCGSHVASARTADQICREAGGTPSGACTGGGSTCKFGPNTGDRCCYGDATGKRDGSCHQGSTSAVDCKGTKIVNNSGHSITVNHYTGGNTFPRSTPSSSEIIPNGGTATAVGCEQIDAPGYCGAAVNLTNCNPTTEEKEHKACVNFACATVPGAGADTCQTSNDCTTTQSHKACVNFACATVPGAGTNTCASDNDCKTTQNHKACVNFACATVPGAGTNTCASDTDCLVTHLECRNFACSRVTGTGSDSCSSDNDCQTHHECRNNNSCVVVSGSGSNQCNVDGDCVPATHKTCQNEACVTVNGSGSSSCNNDNDCKFNNQFSVCDSLTVSPNSGNVSLNVSASLSGHTQNGGSITQYRFNFGDGSSDTVQSGSALSHVYSNPGTFVVNGYVIDNKSNQSGGSGSCQKTVVVYRPEVLGTPPVMPKTGPKEEALVALLAFGVAGFLLRKFGFSLL